MATMKRATRKVGKAKPKAKRAKAKRATPRAAGKVTSASITFRLSAAEKKQALECLKRSGEIRYSFKDIRVTKLPLVLDDGKLID